MVKQSTTLSVLVDVNAKVDKAKAAIEVFKNSLSNLKLSDSLSGNVNKILTKLETEFANFQGLSEKEIFSEKDSKQVKKSFETIIDLMNTLQAHANTIEGLDVSKLIPKDFIDQIKSFGKELKTLADEQKALDSSLEQKTKEKTVAEDKYSKALKARSDLQKKIDSNKNTQAAAVEEQVEAQKRINDLLEQKKTIESKKTKADEEIKQKKKELEEVDNLIKKYQEYQKLKKKDNKTSQEKSKVTRFENQNQDIINKGRSGALTKRKNNLEAEVIKLETIELSSDEIAKLQQVEEAIQKEEQIINQQKAIATKAKNNIAKSTIDLNVLKDTDGLDALKTEFETLEKEVNAFNSTLDPTKLDSFRQKIADFAGVKLDEIPTDLAEIEKYLIKIQSTKVEEISKDLEGIGETAKEIKAPMEELRKSVNELGETGKHFDDVNNDIQRLKQNVIDFFSIGNAVQLFKRAVKSAFDTVKELDATMTEAAVVTDFSIGDMWDKLPEYSGEASKLGATINDLYGATTLYYQQGLKTNEAVALGIETMKMARIANMEAKDATEAMTAALRGFNMELNETSATRVNDVYSELAAITAADTEQIATAMSKTASIASAANMEFESTAAFLSQIIETTQEAPETAGTALKTIIARFSEVKSLREKGLSSGEDSEGELIDVNKIQGALRTVGISMDEFFAGTEGLDSVLMKLASKWETLDFETQRYIATTAAGSRQQSRFIAMMSDYDRTMELVGAANNSAGASQEQFNKTLESLDAKLNNLKNAWDQFVMGLANNDIIKVGVDLLTNLLNTINNIISVTSGGSGIVKTFITALIGLKAFNFGKSMLGQTNIGKRIGEVFGSASQNTKEQADSNQKSSKQKTSLISRLFGNKKEANKEGEDFATRFVNSLKSTTEKLKNKNNGKNKNIFSQFFGEDDSKDFDFIKSFSNLDKAQKEALSKNKDFKQLFLDSVTINNENIDKNSLSNLIDNMGFEQVIDESDKLGLSFESMGQQLDEAGQKSNQFKQQNITLTESLDKAGQAAGIAGGAMMAFAAILRTAGASDEAVAVVEGIGVALMALSAILPVVSTIIQICAKQGVAAFTEMAAAAWASLGPYAIIIAAIMAIVGALIALGIAAKKASPQEQLKNAQKDLEANKKQVEELTESYENLKSTIDSLDEAQKSIKNLTKGTSEWNKAILNTNAQVRNLVNQYPELMKYVTSEGGVLSIDLDSQGVQDILDNSLNQVISATTSQIAMQNVVSEKEQEVAYDNARVESYYEGMTLILEQKTSSGVYEYDEAGNIKTDENGNYIEKEEFMGNGFDIGNSDYQDALFSSLAEAYANGDLVLSNDSSEEARQENIYGDNGLKQEIADILTNNEAFEGFNLDADEIERNSENWANQISKDVSVITMFGDALLKTTPIIEQYSYELSRQAALIAGLSEKGYKNEQISGAEEYGAIVASEIIEKERQNLEGADEGAIKAEFAKSQGLTYSGSGDKYIKYDEEGNIQEVEYSYASVKEAVAANRATEKLAQGQIEFIQKADSAIKSGSNIDKAISKAFKSSEGLGLSSQDLKTLAGYFEYKDGENVVKADKEEELRNIFEEWGGEEIFGSFERFIEHLSGSIRNFQDVVAQTTSIWSNSLTEEAKNDPNNIMGQAIAGGTLDLSKIISGIDGVDLTAGQFEGLANSLMKVYSAGGDVKAFGEQLSIILGQIKEKDIPEVLNLLSTTDFSNKDSIEQTMQGIENLGYEIDDNLLKTLVETSKAIRKVNIEKLNEKLKTLDGVIKSVTDKIENGEKTYSKEDVDTLRDQGIDTSQFVRIGIDEYSFIGDTNKLLSSLNENVASILAQITGDLREQVNIGEKIDNIMTNGNKTWTIGEERYTEGQILNQIRYGKLKASQFEEGKGEDALRKLAIDLGIDSTFVDSSGIEKLITKITEHLDTYWGTNGEVYNQNKNALESEEKGAKTFEYSASDDSGKIDAYGAWQQGVQDIEAEKQSGELTDPQSREAQKANYDALKDSLDGLIASEDGLSIAIERSKKELREQGKYIDSDLVKQLGINARVAAKNQDKLNSAVSDNIEAFKKGEKAGDAYDVALEQITEAAQDVFGSHITSDFVEENAELFKVLAKGGPEAEEAFIQIGQKAAEALIGINGITQDTVDSVTSKLQEIPTDIRMGGTFDATDILGGLNTTEAEALRTAEILEALGYTVELQWQWVDTDGDGVKEKVLKSAVAKRTSASGYSGATKSGGGGGGGSKKPEKQTWENPYDELYNTQQKVDETLRERNQLEREYDRLLENRDVSAAKLLENQAKQLKNLRQEYDLQKKIANQELKDAKNAKNYEYLATRKKGDEEEQVWSTFQKEADYYGMGDLNKYAKYNADTGEIEINWDKIEALEDDTKHGEDMGALIEAYISHLEEQSDAYEEAADRLEEIEDEVREIKKQAMEDYLDFEQKVYDALVQQAQQEIDDMQSLSDTLSEANSSILDSLQESIDLERQIRDNTKQEEDIADMEARLAYLRRDTSGANALEIKQLEEQLGDARESYSDSLIDQQLQKLSDDNAKAEEQRQQQIELAQAQLDYWTEIGYFWPKVDELITEAVKAEDFSETDLAEVLKDTEGFKGMSYFGKKNWMYELAQEFALAGQGKSNWKVEEAEQAGKLKKGQVVNEKGKSVGALTYDKKNKVWKDSNGGTYDTLTWDEAQGKYVASGYTPKKEETPPNGTPIGDPTTETYPYGKPSEATKTVKKGQTGQQVKAVQYALNKLGYGNSGTSSVDGKFGSGTEKAVKAFQSAMGISKDGVVGKDTRAKFKLKKFKTGGIADFTGPAWLDGTKSKPEIILNQQDSKNFIMLKDVLGEILQGATSGKGKTSGGGDNYFDISIIVDEISSDYDVDQMAARIKQQIYDDSTYRNVNAINLIR